MKVKKILAVICVCAVAMFTFTACGGVDNETTESTTAEASTTETVNDNTAENNSETIEINSASFTGTYAPSMIVDADGTEMTYDEYVSQAAAAQGYEEGSDEYTSFTDSAKASYVFSSDNTVKATMGDEEKDGTFQFDGSSVLTTSFDGVNTEYTYDSAENTLTAKDPDTGITVVLAAA